MLLTWELGSGLGHVARLSPVARGLAKRGHDVSAALCRPELGADWFGEVRCQPAPPIDVLPEAQRRSVRTFADILANAKWDQYETLGRQVSRWRELIDGVKPDLIVMDHSPTAQLATQGVDVKRVLVGTGFVIPPNVCPLPCLDPRKTDEPVDVSVEMVVLETVNRCLADVNQPSLSQLSELFTRAEAVMLTTLAELDHYGPRADTKYWGAWPGSGGAAPTWPRGRGPKVFAYVKPFPALNPMLHMLNKSGLPTLVYLSGASDEQADAVTGGNLKLVNHPVDLQRAAQACELAILHAGLGATTDLLLAGVPLLLLPQQQEQLLLATRVAQLGAAQIASCDAPEQISVGLQRLLTDKRLTRAAEAFAGKYKGYNPDERIRRVVEHLDGLL